MKEIESVVTKYTQVCAFCGSPVEAEHHLIFGRAERMKADEDDLVLPVCNACHNMGRISNRPIKGQGTMIIHGNSMAEAMSRMIGQLAWEKEFYRKEYVKHKFRYVTVDADEDEARERFRMRYGKSFL